MTSTRILYGSDISQPIRAIRMTLEALELDYELQEFDINAEAHKNNSVSLEKCVENMTITILQDVDGTCLWEADKIMMYLVTKYGKDDKLYPQDFDERLTVERCLHFGNEKDYIDGWIDKTLSGVVKEVDLPIIIDLVNNAYSLLDMLMGNYNYIAGKEITIADFSNATTVAALIGFTPIDKLKYPKLAMWYEEMKKLQYFEKVNGKIIKNIEERIKNLL